MSWLYTVLFAGLMFSSQGSSASTAQPSLQDVPVAVEAVQADETESFDQSYPLNAGGRVNVSNVNGSIIVEAWDKNEVRLQYTKTADSKDRLADVTVRIESKSEYFSAEADYGNWNNRNLSGGWKNGGKLNIDFHLMVPRTAVLNEVQTVNGSVTVSNFVNSTRASAVNGTVIASNIRGTAKLSTVNGELKADFDRLEPGSKISLETVNGRVNLTLPSDANATVKADSLNGAISNDFGLPIRKGKYVGRDLYGRLGNGDIQVKLSSVNGVLAIGRKSDGRNLSPATNLLTQKPGDDEDWDMNDEDFKSAKVDKEVARAAKEVAKNQSKASAKALADAQKEIEKMGPDMAKIAGETSERTAEVLKQTAEIMKSDAMKQQLKIASDIQTNIQTNIQNNVLPKLAGFNVFPSSPRMERKSETFPIKGTPKVSVVANGCSVTVRGWDRSEVQYRVMQVSDQRDTETMGITADHTDSAVTIRVNNPSSNGFRWNNDNSRTRIEVFVPKNSNLKIKTDGEIRLDGVVGDVDLSGSDESINVRDVEGNLTVSSSDGLIRVIGFKGEISAQSSDGTISLEGDFKKLKAHASDGEIFLTLPETAQVDLDATADDLHGDGIVLTRISGNEKTSKYRIGNGGTTFQVETEGEIHVRGANTLNSIDSL